MLLTLSRWRIYDGDNTRYYQGSINPSSSRSDAAFVGYNNMWLNLTNGNLIGIRISCFAWDERYYFGNTLIVSRKPFAKFISYSQLPLCPLFTTGPNVSLMYNFINYNVSALLSSSISLAPGNGTSMRWWLNGSQLVVGGQFMIDENGTLIIRDVNYSNGGIYQIDTGGNTERNLSTFYVQVVGQLRQTF